MSRMLDGRAAIVTGAGRGIGRAIARALAAQGARVALAARGVEALEAVRAEVERAGGSAAVVPTDVSVEEQVRRLVAAAERAFGRLDILVNNAGVAPRNPVAETTTEQWDEAMAVNARGPFLLCREALPLMRRTVRAGGPAARGFIVNIASVVGVKGYVQQAAYTASKHALMGLTKVLAQEVKGDGIRVHAICPGGVDTPLVRGIRPDLPPEALMAPEEIAELVVFLVTRTGNAVVDEVRVRREAAEPWF